jgi:hypothetical protein
MRGNVEPQRSPCSPVLTLLPQSWYSLGMETDSPQSFSEAELLYQYLGKRLGNGGRNASVEELIAEFAEYRRELEEVRAKLREAVESSSRGESGPLDLKDVIRRGRERLAAEGITD